MGCGSSTAGGAYGAGDDAPAALSAEKHEEMKGMFDELDADKDGKISRSEIKKAMTKACGGEEPSEEDIMQLLDRIDKDHNGEVEFDEFVTMAAWRLHLLAKGIRDMSRASQTDRASTRLSQQKTGFFNMRSSRVVAT